MKNIHIITFLASLLVSTAVWSQNPVPDPDTIPNPVQEGDPAIKTLPPRLDYVEDKQRIRAEELPDAVRQTLESDARYANWKDATIFRDENTDEYIVEFREEGKTTTYKFSKEGTPIMEK
jgi:hypothetical protein